MLAKAITNGPLGKTHTISFTLNPFYLRGDFDGDGKPDYAVRVVRRVDGRVGLVIVHGGDRPAILLGPGNGFGAGADKFDWVDYWYVVPKGPVGRGAVDGPVPKLRGDAILAGKSESASGLIYWSGARYAWYQQGD